MLEVGWSELLVIAIVMIVVVGPKDLPKMLRTFATFVKKARGMAHDFQSQFTDAMRDAEMDELRKTLADVRSLSPKNALKEAFDPIRKAGEDIRRDIETAKPNSNTIAAATPAAQPVSTPDPIAMPEPVSAPLPQVVLPAGLPAELAPVAAKAKAAKAKAVPAKKLRAKKPEPEA